MGLERSDRGKESARRERLGQQRGTCRCKTAVVDESVGVSRREQDVDRGMVGGDPVCEFGAGHARHDDVAEQQLDGFGSAVY
ncbi:hypothetical protein Acsp01_60840 [Actinoplanes sp. NBRC 101535]|nr:hypothetical protein Acsp01_60840 [Actinoplanes sp. NBRC 101535]